MDWFENVFFEKAGSRIKRLALVLFAVEFVVSAIAAVISFFALLFTAEDTGGAFLLTPIGFVLAVGAEWLFTLPLYGFGELLEKVFEIEENTRKEKKKSKSSEPINLETSVSNGRAPLFSNAADNGSWRCPECDALNSASRHTCQMCQRPRKTGTPVPEAEHLVYCPVCGIKNKAGLKRCWSCDAPL